MRSTHAFLLLSALLVLASACSGDDGGSAVAFGGVEDGAEVASPLAVTFTADGFDIVPAGEAGDAEDAGHMHVMIDVGCVAPGEVIPDDDSHLHFGDGSTSAELDLEPGEHTLCLQAGDDIHTALDITDEITVTVTS